MEDGGTVLIQVAEDVDIRIAQSAIARKVTAEPAADQPAAD